MAAGQNPVKAACSIFRPTNAVSHAKAGWIKCVRARLSKTIKPANAITARSMFILNLSLVGGYKCDVYPLAFI
jgi:hypothetical protein